MTTTPSSHGGYRPGAGRPAQEPTRRLSVPVSQVPAVTAWLEIYRQPAVAEYPTPVTLNPTTVHLGSFASRVPAGWPSPAEEYIEPTIDLNQALVVKGHEASTFVLRVKGWSMMLAGIFDGDRIVVDRALSPRKGQIVVAVLNNELTIKRLGDVDGKLALIPENPHFQPITLEEGDHMEVWGVVTHCLRDLGAR